jgi:acyl-CoA thioesterase FadM
MTMLERPETAVPTPFVSSVMRVEPGWIDYNGHLNMAYYNVLFDRAVDEVYELLGLGLAYVEVSRHSTFTAEVHVRYLRELRVDDPVRVTFQLLGYDAKRLHYFEELHHACLSSGDRRAPWAYEDCSRKSADPGRRGTADRHAGDHLNFGGGRFYGRKL